MYLENVIEKKVLTNNESEIFEYTIFKQPADIKLDIMKHET